MPFLPNLPRYQSHKVVQAAKITGIDREGFRLLLDDTQVEAWVVVGEYWLDRHNPEVGGYFVMYDDGYSSYSPADAFEKGHTPLEKRAP